MKRWWRTTCRFFDFLKDRYFKTKIKYLLKKASLSSFAHILHFSLYYFNGVSSHPLPFYIKVMTSLHDKRITCCGGKCNKRHIIQLKHSWHSTDIMARKSDWFACVLPRYITWRNCGLRIAKPMRLVSFSPLTCSCWFGNYFCLIAEGVDRLRMAGATGETTDSSGASPRQQASRKPPKNRLSCQVTLLDGTVLTTDHLQVSALNECFCTD